MTQALRALESFCLDICTAKLQRGLGQVAVDGGHGHGVVFFLSRRKPLAEAEGLHVALEVAVQEAVEDRVDADGAHGSQVAQ